MKFKNQLCDGENSYIRSGRLTPVGADLPSAGGNAAIFAKFHSASKTFGARTGKLLNKPLGGKHHIMIGRSKIEKNDEKAHY